MVTVCSSPFLPSPLLTMALLAEKETNEDLKDLKNKTKSNASKKPHKIRKVKYLPGISWLKHSFLVNYVWEPTKRKVKLSSRGVRATGVQHPLRDSSWQINTGLAGNSLTLVTQTLFRQSEADHILPHMSAKSPLHCLQGCQGCAEAAVLLPGHYWWEEKRILSTKWTPESAEGTDQLLLLTFPETPTCGHPNPIPLLWEPQHRSVCGCWLSILPLQSMGFLKFILTLLIHITTLHLAAGSVPNTEFVQPTITILIFDGYIH